MRSNIYTLAQSETGNYNTKKSAARILYGRGSDITNEKAVQRRARCKLITQTTILKLIDVAKERGAKDRVNAYWNTYHCQNLVYSENGRLYAPNCKNRFCTYCCGIRKAELINKYLPVLHSWKEPYFVTLTIKAVKAIHLAKAIKKMNRAFQRINAKYRKRAQRNSSSKLIGIRTLECNFNPKYKTYNPHFHLIVPDRAMAETIIDEWLLLWTDKYTHRDAQNSRKVKDTEKDLIEVIKYEAKIFTEPEGKKSKGKKGSVKIYARALDNIYAALKGSRVIDRFGFNIKSPKKEKVNSHIAKDCMEWKYDLKSMDWVNDDHASTLTAFVPDAGLEALLEYHIDTEAE